jgi:hypothetical protein
MIQLVRERAPEEVFAESSFSYSHSDVPEENKQFLARRRNIYYSPHFS